MKITSYQNNNKTSFGSVNIIQVSKKAFNNSEDYIAINEEFHEAANKITREVGGKLNLVLNLLGLGKKSNKIISYLEEPGYIGIMKELKKSGNYSLSWLRQNTGFPIAENLSEGYHSFTVLTKKHKDASSSLVSTKGLFEVWKKIIKEEIQEVRNGKKTKTAPVLTAAKINQAISEKIKPIIDGEPVNKFIIEDLSELPNVFKQIDY